MTKRTKTAGKKAGGRKKAGFSSRFFNFNYNFTIFYIKGVI